MFNILKHSDAWGLYMTYRSLVLSAVKIQLMIPRKHTILSHNDIIIRWYKASSHLWRDKARSLCNISYQLNYTAANKSVTESALNGMRVLRSLSLTYFIWFQLFPSLILTPRWFWEPYLTHQYTFTAHVSSLHMHMYWNSTVHAYLKKKWWRLIDVC